MKRSIFALFVSFSLLLSLYPPLDLPAIQHGQYPFGAISVFADSNLIVNPGFEEGIYAPGNNPIGWSTDAWRGTSTFTWDSGVAHSGTKSVKITSTVPNDARWVQTVSVVPNSNYILSGWIKTENVGHSPPGELLDIGANLSLYGTWEHSADLKGTNDWTYVSFEFNSGDNTEVTVACRLGYWSSTNTGTAWFDDIALTFVQTIPVTRLEGEHIALELYTEHFNILNDPQAWLEKLDAAYEHLSALVGGVPYQGQMITIKEVAPFDYWAIAGNPIQWNSDYVPRELRSINEHNDISFGINHELSHDFDLLPQSKYYMTNHQLANAEHWANFKMMYAVDQLAVRYPDAVMYQSAIGYTKLAEFANAYFVKQFAQPWIASGRTDWYNMHNDVYTGILYIIRQQIGWEPFKQTFHDYATRTFDPSITETDEGRISLFVNLLSNSAQVDLVPQLTQWGLPVTWVIPREIGYRVYLPLITRGYQAR